MPPVGSCYPDTGTVNTAPVENKNMYLPDEGEKLKKAKFGIYT